ncbi:superoxide dismutase family protein [Sphingomicrobium clamense]|uniref:Superoxide dismutase family protein n=1 Tax=Sphingomicrobium clamense TaxID=2851013 RepID=A0ABS6V7P0_9SPHN|nr:superoxide dismutase family protein [Sphingomicrobium sp. B8]MBW0145496.1 superoxide dismutase family protein [Sphingomicrobium sp. B8]
MRIHYLMTGLAALGLTACGGETEPSKEQAPVDFVDPYDAEIVDASGSAIGTIAVSEDPNGTTLRVSIEGGLSEGMHGVHLHETGLCETPDFSSAGGHWNPTSKEHGRDNPQGSHVGDLANLAIDAEGAGSSTYLVSVLRNGTGPTMADDDGTALVVHAGPDDYQTDPSGDSGARVGCAVLSAPQS